MTSLHPALRRHDRAQVLDGAATPALIRLLDADPIVNAVLSSRVRALGVIGGPSFGGAVIGALDGDDLWAACFAGANLLPVGEDADTLRRIAHFVGSRPRTCSSIIGRTDAVAAVWSVLAGSWGPARAVRAAQPLLVIDRVPAVAPDPAVRVVRIDQRDPFLAAAQAMFVEELGIVPDTDSPSSTFRRRVMDLIADGRAFARVDARGEVAFKAEIAAVSPHTCQIQGVWVRPDLRGRGLATRAMASVIGYALELAPSASLYVNDFNLAARRTYARLEMRQVATLRTILL